MKEYNNIIKEYIQKLTQLSSNFFKKYITIYINSRIFRWSIKRLLLLFEKMELIISFQSVKLQSLLNEFKTEEEKNKLNQEKLNNLEKLSNEFLS